MNRLGKSHAMCPDEGGRCQYGWEGPRLWCPTIYVGRSWGPIIVRALCVLVVIATYVALALGVRP